MSKVGSLFVFAVATGVASTIMRCRVARRPLCVGASRPSGRVLAGSLRRLRARLKRDRTKAAPRRGVAASARPPLVACPCLAVSVAAGACGLWPRGGPRPRALPPSRAPPRSGIRFVIKGPKRTKRDPRPVRRNFFYYSGLIARPAARPPGRGGPRPRPANAPRGSVKSRVGPLFDRSLPDERRHRSRSRPDRTTPRARPYRWTRLPAPSGRLRGRKACKRDLSGAVSLQRLNGRWPQGRDTQPRATSHVALTLGDLARGSERKPRVGKAYWRPLADLHTPALRAQHPSGQIRPGQRHHQAAVAAAA
jgi:hypothetical protein